MKRLLQLSVLMNIVLLVAVGWRTASQAPMPRTIRAEVGTPAQQKAPSKFFSRRTVASSPATPWDAIESSDPRRFIANLRAVGCPEETIRDIVTLRVCRAYHDRLVNREAEAARLWDYTRNPDWRENRRRLHQQREMRNEMIYTLESLLGRNWRELSASILGWPRTGQDATEVFDVEKRRQLRELDERYRQAKEEFDNKRMLGLLDEADAARLRELERQKRTELAAILSPQELEEYLYRCSPAADYVRQNLPPAKSESEFRVMVRVALEFEMSNEPMTPFERYGPESSNLQLYASQTERGAAFQKRLEEVLGEARIAEQQAEEQQRREEARREQEQRNKERIRAELIDLAGSVGIAEANAQRFFDRLMELEPVLKAQFDAMERNLTGAGEEKLKQEEAAMKAELKKIAVETLGEKGKALVEKVANR